MTEKLTWNVTVTAAGGPRLAQGGDLVVDAYDKISVVVPANSATTVDLGPTDVGRMTCLVIAPAKPAKELTYDVGSVTVVLDYPQFLFGGAVGLTGNPSKLTLKNAGAAEAAVSIFVGRTAINPPPPPPPNP
ncbi:hypothetical protein [Pseudonocardia sp. DLS-67]